MRAKPHKQRLFVVGLIVLSHIEDVLVLLLIVESLVLRLWLIFLLLSFPLCFHFAICCSNEVQYVEYGEMYVGL